MVTFKIPFFKRTGTTTIIEPFCGSGELLNFIEIETFDIDPKIKVSETRDTILNPPSYQDKYILTNPPYLARNKWKEKKLFDIYNVNDLYKCFVKELLTNQCQGGIIIIPLNFWSSILLFH